METSRLRLTLVSGKEEKDEEKLRTLVGSIDMIRSKIPTEIFHFRKNLGTETVL